MGVCGWLRLCHTGVGVGVPTPTQGRATPAPHRAATSEGPALSRGGSGEGGHVGI